MRRIARLAADGVGAREWLEMGGEKKPLVMSERGCADGCGRLRTANGCGELRGRLWTAWVQREWLEMGGEKKPLVMSELGCADGCGHEMGVENCADGCARHGCKGEMGWEKKPLVMSELGCADGSDGEGCREVRGWLWTARGLGWGEEAAGDERARLRGRLRTGNLRADKQNDSKQI